MTHSQLIPRGYRQTVGSVASAVRCPIVWDWRGPPPLVGLSVGDFHSIQTTQERRKKTEMTAGVQGNKSKYTNIYLFIEVYLRMSPWWSLMYVVFIACQVELSQATRVSVVV